MYQAFSEGVFKNKIANSFPGGVFIQAGSMPVSGDLETGEAMPLYHEVGRVLKGLIAKSGEHYFIVFVSNEKYTAK